MDEHEIVDELVRKYGYKVAGKLSDGFVLRRPDGTLMRTSEAMAELERLTTPEGR
jgi:hypothetical protein